MLVGRVEFGACAQKALAGSVDDLAHERVGLARRAPSAVGGFRGRHDAEGRAPSVREPRPRGRRGGCVEQVEKTVVNGQE